MAEIEQQQAVEPAAPPPPRSRQEIAAEVFGPAYVGEVGKAEPKEKAPEPEDAHEGEVPDEEPAEGEPVGEPEGETAAEDTGEMPIATVSELLEHLGDDTDPSWFNGLKMSFNVDGMPTEATIKDLVDSYQIRGAAEHRLETAKAIAQKESETWAAKQQELEGQFQVLAELIKTEEATLEQDVKAIDPSLRDTDPAEWAARVTEFQHRRGHIERMKVDTVEKYKANVQARAAEFETQKSSYKVEQYNALVEKMPELRDPARAEAENTKVAGYAYRSGFTPQEYENLLDHRSWLILRKAMLYDESRGQVDTAKKRVAKVPKVMKPGAPKPMEQRAAEKLQVLKSRLERSGSIDDAVAYRMAKRGAQRR